jgi:peptide deformylase
MKFTVVHYGDPILRQRGARVAAVDDKLRGTIAGMFDTMYEANGIGLAAQQVGMALQLAIIDVRGVKDRPSQLWISGQPADVDAFMPLVLINPTIRPVGEVAAGPEGCLSFPEIYGDVCRPAEVEVQAINDRNESFEFKAGGLLARAIQHEVDHLNGVLFIDRMDSKNRSEVRDEVDTLQADTKKQLKRK